MASAIGDILPLAVGVAVSPIPIVAVILMLFSARARSNGPAFLLGWLVGLIVVGVIVLAVSDAGDVDSSDDASTLGSWLKLLFGLALLFLAVRQWRGRPREGDEPKVPKWMQAIDAVTPVKALGLGVLLSAVNPKNLMLIVGAGVSIAQSGLSAGDTAIVYGVFVLIACASIAGPVIYYLVGGDGAKKTMDGWKEWLLANNAAVMAVLLLVMGASLLGKGIAGVFG
jgi:threonine/homoserine/homoserine lactone efflux protein